MSEPDYITNTSVDGNAQSYFSGDAVGGHFFDNTVTAFHSPDSTYTGYATNGYFYSSGVIDSSNVASWSKEGDDTVWSAQGLTRDAGTRSDQDRFPDRVFIFYSKTEVSIINARDLKIWMKFNLSTLPAFISGVEVLSAKFSAGILTVLAQQQSNTDAGGVFLVYNFKRDCLSITTSSLFHIREFIWNRNDTAVMGTLTDTSAVYPFTTTGISIDHTVSGTGSAFPSNPLYCLDINYVGNVVKGLIGGLGVYMGFNLEAHTETVGSTDYKAPLFKQHNQTLSLTINSANVNLTDVLSSQQPDGLTREWKFTDATGGVNDWFNSGVRFKDIVKISGASYKSYFIVNGAFSSGQQSFDLFILYSSTDELKSSSVDLPGWQNGSGTFLTVRNDLEAQNQYEILKPIRYVKVLSNGEFLLISGKTEVYHISGSSITDHSDITQFSLFSNRGSDIPSISPGSGGHNIFGFTANLEETFLLLENSVLKVTIDDLKLKNSTNVLITSTEIAGSLDSTENIDLNLPRGIVIDPVSGNVFFGGTKGALATDRNSYIIELTPQGVVQSCSVFRAKSAGSAEGPIIMDGYFNPSGTEV